MLKRILLLLPLALAAILHAGEPPSAARFSDTVSGGKISLTARLRWENADQANLTTSNAFTLRTALGLTSAPFAGFQAMIEAENIVSLGERDNYNAAGTNPGGVGHAVIADPPGSGVSQAWLAYTRAPATLKVGRQRIVLDNARFVGDSGWRQNLQTFDAAALALKPAPDFALAYDYVWHVNRVFGNKAPQPDFSGDVHLVNASYGGWSHGKLTAYAYLLDLDNSAANSSDTFGASFAGSTPATKDFKVTYRAEFATQRNAGKNPVNYRSDYYVLELGGATKAFAFNGGCEVLGSDAGKQGFATPLATLHAFNGWADVFLNTPAKGLRDLYISATLTLPHGVPLRVVYHDYTSDLGHVAYGREWNVQLSRKLNQNWSVLAKAARFDSRAPFADLTRFWLQCDLTL